METHGMQEFLPLMDPKRASIFLQPCYGGAQLRLIAEHPQYRAAARSTWAAATDTVNHLGDTFEEVLHEAFKKKNGFAAADINRDGHVSMGEIRYFADTQNAYQDSIGYDAEGQQIVDNQRQNNPEAGNLA